MLDIALNPIRVTSHSTVKYVPVEVLNVGQQKAIARLHTMRLHVKPDVTRMKCNGMREFVAQIIPDSATLHPGYLLLPSVREARTPSIFLKCHKESRLRLHTDAAGYFITSTTLTRKINAI